eukprot:TRINITY_DN23476_c2_g1_i1.p1 TRINITY_DN23476_c2_g1~~TRINITY_DN23476_c2_g1_i1.p1  ORF type:complete len:879 (+),score=101.51 TRINITY_DN23476_c2_g1_i1:56-2638(+)
MATMRVLQGSLPGETEHLIQSGFGTLHGVCGQVDDAAQVCFVFPIRVPTDAPQPTRWFTPTRVAINWDEVLHDPGESAAALFTDFHSHPGIDYLHALRDKSDPTLQSVRREEIMRSCMEIGPTKLSFEAYSEVFREFFISYLQGPKCGFKVSTMVSFDKDEVFVFVELPTEKFDVLTNNVNDANVSAVQVSTAEVLGINSNMKVAISEEFYERAKQYLDEQEGKQNRVLAAMGSKEVCSLSTTDKRRTEFTIPKTNEGLYFPMHLAMQGRLLTVNDAGERISPFVPLRRKDLTRLIYQRIEDVFDLQHMLKQQMILSHFPLHRYNHSEEPSVVGFHEKWMSWRNFFPTFKEKEDYTDDIWCYFGDEVGFLFLFLITYRRNLFLPFIVALIMALRFYLPTEGAVTFASVCFGFFMTIWSIHFVQSYEMIEGGTSMRWGAGLSSSVARRFLSTWKKEADISWTSGRLRVFLYEVLGSTLGFALLVLIFTGVVTVETLRGSLILHPHSWTHTREFLHKYILPKASSSDLDSIVSSGGSKLSAVMITIQIRSLDIIWDRVARWLVKHENNRTEAELNDSLAQKLYIVKVINMLYPFLFISFGMEIIDGGCGGEGGCMYELQRSLTFMFVTALLLDVVWFIISIVLTRWQIQSELRFDSTSVATRYTYSQIQAKLSGPQDITADVLPHILKFTCVCSFSVACPHLVVVLFLYTCSMIKLVLLRRLRVYKLSRPTQTSGLGIWSSLLKLSVGISIVINTLLIVFAMEPIKNWSRRDQMVVFVCIEHAFVLFVIVGLVVFPTTPREAVMLADLNMAQLSRVLNPKRENRDSPCQCYSEVVPEWPKVSALDVSPSRCRHTSRSGSEPV